MKRRKKALVLVLFSLPLIFFASLYVPIPRDRLGPGRVVSLRLTDRQGILLREVLSDEGGRCRWIPLKEISPYLLKATIASEDSQFLIHSGLDVVAVLRAAWQNLRHGKVVSGASTISQQLVRNIYHQERNLPSKILEVWRSLRLERMLSKEEILVQYLNRISYGNQTFGIEAASRLYFDKPSSQLDLAEAAFLAGLPRAPTQSNPYRSLGDAQRRQRDVMRRMCRLRFISVEEMGRAFSEKLRLLPASEKFRAPHFCDFVLEQLPASKKQDLSVIETTLDYHLQERVGLLLENHLRGLEKRGISNGAVVVLDNASGEILSLVGSRDFFDEAHDGQVNGALSLRQPGSTLKPFTYALALEKGMTAASILEDVPEQFLTLEGSFFPQNYDRRYHGPIRMRSALACSYNIPAVSVLDSVGTDLLYQRLKSLGFESLKKSPGFYGVGLTLGNGEVKLLELVRAYAALARGGVFLREKSKLRMTDKNNRPQDADVPPQRNRVFSLPVAYVITSILSDKDARVPAFGYNSPLNLPFPAAAKTGTSKDFRDNWTVGFTRRYTVGVWVGNFGGEPMHNVSGISGCGPLYKDIMLLLHKDCDPPPFEEPGNVVRLRICAVSGGIATAACPGGIDEVFIRGTEPRLSCSIHRPSGPQGGDSQPSKGIRSPAAIAIIFPREGDFFKIDPVLRAEFQALKFRARVSSDREIGPVEWWVNGERIARAVFPYAFSWILKPGSYTIKATARAGQKTLESQPIKFKVVS